MNKQEIAATLEAMADLMELSEENPFRARSFRAGARALDGITGDLGDLIAGGRLREVKGIGSALEEVIADLWREGRSARHEELKSKVPPGLLEMLQVQGLGPKRARVLHQKLGICDLASLKAACKAGKVAAVSGFGEKSQEKILAGITYLGQVSGRFLFSEAREAARPLLDAVRAAPGVVRAELAGSLRRRRETVKDIDIVVSSRQPAAAMERFVAAAGAGAEVLARGETKTSVRLPRGIQADLRVVADAEYPFALLYFTGSMEHNTAMRGRAKARGFKLNEYGLFRVDAARPSEEGEPIPGLSEEEIFRALGLDPIPPELRENLGEIDLAEAHKLPDLVEVKDLRGIVHVHSVASDGRNTLEQLVEAARARGLEYLALSDHSQSAGYAGGLKEDRVIQQHQEVDRLNARLKGFRIFKGIESDIRADGSLDYPPEVLDRFDFVIASVHSAFSLSEDEQTRRVLKAMQDPHCTILGHPTGRLLLQREAFPLRMEEILRAAGDLGVIVEINANPLRLDLDWRWGKFAREAKVRTCISPDAHSIQDFDYHEIGVGIARKGGFPAREVVNTYAAGDFEKALSSRRA